MIIGFQILLAVLLAFGIFFAMYGFARFIDWLTETYP